MAQSPLQTDVLQLEPGSGDTLTVSRDSSDGSMKFVDALITSGVTLSGLIGMRSITGVYVVGRGGSGAAYTTIQSALDAIPDTSSAALSALVWVLPGVYTENVTVQNDGVIISSPGGAKLINSGASDTLTISASLDTTPLKVIIRGMEIENDQAAYACIRCLGADTFASGTVTAVNAPLAAGDTLTVNGTALTGIAGTRASGSNNFSTLGTTTDAIAAEIAAALNDASNAWADDITASVASSVVTIQANTAGSGGNAITLAVSTTPSGGLTLSGATLSGGSADGSSVLSQGLLVEDCVLIASGVGGYQINADTCNDIWVRGGTWRGSAATSLVRAADCSSLRVSGVEWANEFNLSYDTANDEPSSGASDYTILNCGRVSDLTVDLESGGSLILRDLPVVGDLTMGGTQTVAAVACGMGAVDLSDTVAATFSRCVRTSATASSGTPTLSESKVVGSSAFSSSTQESVVFDPPQPDATYYVLLEAPSATTLSVSSKAATGFDIDSSASLTGTVGYVVVRDL